MESTNPFIAGPMLQNPQLFVGRKEQLRAIISRMQGVQPTSVNIVGEPQIGKSSLLYYFFLTWEQRILDPSKYVTVYISLKKVYCQKEENFYQVIAQELLNSPTVQVRPILNEVLRKIPLGRMEFSQAIAEFENQGLLPVLCLDDFESLFKYPKEFNNGFYDNLRSLMDNNVLMLILASCETLDVYASKYRFVSRFFNVGHVIKLGDLDTDEATELINFSTVCSKGKIPALNSEEQSYAHSWGKCHPYLLQLAGWYLWEARYNGKSIKWAKNSFEQQKKQFEKQKKYSPPYLPISVKKGKTENKNIIWFLKTLPKMVGEFVATLENLTKSIV